LSLKTKVNDLLVVWPQNHWAVFSGLASKPVVVVGFLVETQHQGGGSGFSVWTSKPTAMVW
jgi:hypothetical protein